MTKKEKIKNLKKIKKLLKETEKFVEIKDEYEREKIVKTKLIKIENIIEKLVTKHSYTIFF